MAVSSVSRPAFQARSRIAAASDRLTCPVSFAIRSEEHTSELQSQSKLVCRLLLEKKRLSAGIEGASALQVTTFPVHESKQAQDTPQRSIVADPLRVALGEAEI